LSTALPLILKSITLRNLRCHSFKSWELNSGMNIFQGENGTGKTTVLEAAYMMAHGRSFRQSRDPELVNWQAKSFQLESKWQRYGPVYVSITGKRGRTEVKLQGKAVAKRKELIETLPVIADAPQARRLIDGVTGERRRWLDQLLSVCEPAFQTHYTAYLRAMMQRSRLLRRQQDDAQLDVWEHQLVQHGKIVRQLRQQVIERLNFHLCEESSWLDAPLEIHIDQAEIKVASDSSMMNWSDALAYYRSKDRKTRRCSIGPHTDTIRNTHQGREIRTVGSRGQQKLASIALRLAECATRYGYRHLWPLLLLDDCMEALDDKRRFRLLLRLQQYPGQILMTAPNNLMMPEDISATILHMSEDCGESDQQQRFTADMEKAA